MLTLLLIMTMFGQGQSLVDYGVEFITAFPENVAHFYPFYADNSLNITALYDNTDVSVYFQGSLLYDTILNQGETENYILPGNVQKDEFTQSLKTVRVVSSSYIVVVSKSMQGDSVQTNVIPPTGKLGLFYNIPILNYNTMLSTFYQTPTNTSKGYKYFRLLIINAKSFTNNITIIRQQFQSESVVLQPHAVLQLQLNGSEIAIDASYRVAVIMAHPCLESTTCQCNMVVNQLRPVTQWGLSFVLPYLNTTTWSHVTKYSIKTGDVAASAGNLVPVLPGTQYITTIDPVSLRLISPGLILEVIPESMFSACYLVHFSWVYSKVLVIAQTDSQLQVSIDSGLSLPFAFWTPIANTQYSMASVTLRGKHIIWHPTSKIAVYMFRKMASGILYGGPAIPLSDTPDPAGCAFFPAEFTIAPIPMSWPESHEYCTSTSSELVSPSTETAHGALTDFLLTTSSNEHWIGLRRSLLTLDWYWQKGTESVDLNYTLWSTGEPLFPVMGMCASIFPTMTWNSVPCCTQLKPVCYRPPDYFPLVMV